MLLAGRCPERRWIFQTLSLAASGAVIEEAAEGGLPEPISYLVAVVPFFVTSFCTRQLISSPTQISFSEGHAMA